jgi:hypothetical protein
MDIRFALFDKVANHQLLSAARSDVLRKREADVEFSLGLG